MTCMYNDMHKMFLFYLTKKLKNLQVYLSLVAYLVTYFASYNIL